MTPKSSGLSWLLPNRGCEDSYGHEDTSPSRWPQTPFTIQNPPIQSFELVANRVREGPYGQKHPSPSRWPDAPFTIQNAQFSSLTRLPP